MQRFLLYILLLLLLNACTSHPKYRCRTKVLSYEEMKKTPVSGQFHIGTQNLSK